MLATPAEAKQGMFWYDVKTWLGVAFFIGITAPFALSGIADVFGGLFLFVWWYRRAKYRPIYEFSLGQGKAFESAKRAVIAADKFDRQMLDLHFQAYSLCLTCQALHELGLRMCAGLQGIYPHSPTEEPPNPNPWQWYWFKWHGYPPPPADWSICRKYTPGRYWDIQALKASGREYYASQKNSLWELGYGDIPDWYISGSNPQERQSFNRLIQRIGLTSAKCPPKAGLRLSALECKDQIQQERDRFMREFDNQNPEIQEELRLIDEYAQSVIEKDTWLLMDNGFLHFDYSRAFQEAINTSIRRLRGRASLHGIDADAILASSLNSAGKRVPTLTKETSKMIREDRKAKEAQARRFIHSIVNLHRGRIGEVRKHFSHYMLEDDDTSTDVKIIDIQVVSNLERDNWALLRPELVRTAVGEDFLYTVNSSVERVWGALIANNISFEEIFGHEPSIQ